MKGTSVCAQVKIFLNMNNSRISEEVKIKNHLSSAESMDIEYSPDRQKIPNDRQALTKGCVGKA
jgi:hypothetical protein